MAGLVVPGNHSMNPSTRSNVARQFLRFTMGGALNTGVSYLMYIVLIGWMTYQTAYFLAYMTGIIFSYFFNAKIVFKTKFYWKAFFAFPSVYILQYGISALSMRLLVENFTISKLIAPLVVAILTLPVTYCLSKYILQKLQPRAVENI